MKTCPLCQHRSNELIHTFQDKRLGTRSFFLCPDCRLIFLDPQQRLSPAEERTRYDLHRNNPEDKGYVQFLNQALDPLLPFLKKGMTGLDYGSGPGPTLSGLFSEHGYEVENYDPFYADDKQVLKKQYDFIVCTETAEHFYHPDEEFQTIRGLLKPEGYAGLMTQMPPEDKDFKDWWYWREPTHVCFYQPETFAWIAEKYLFLIKHLKNNIVILERKEDE